MRYCFGDINYASLSGRIEEIQFNHEYPDQNFYKARLRVERQSGTVDFVPLIIGESKLPNDFESLRGQNVTVGGQIRSYWIHEGETAHSELTVFVQNIRIKDKTKGDMDTNYVELEGTLTKEPMYRETPLGRKIADLMIESSRKPRQSAFIPCIAWGRDAWYVSRLKVGDRIKIAGRFQSRKYLKRNPISGEDELKETQEISICIVH